MRGRGRAAAVFDRSLASPVRHGAGTNRRRRCWPWPRGAGTGLAEGGGGRGGRGQADVGRTGACSPTTGGGHGWNGRAGDPLAGRPLRHGARLGPQDRLGPLADGDLRRGRPRPRCACCAAEQCSDRGTRARQANRASSFHLAGERRGPALRRGHGSPGRGRRAARSWTSRTKAASRRRGGERSAILRADLARARPGRRLPLRRPRRTSAGCSDPTKNGWPTSSPPSPAPRWRTPKASPSCNS